MKLRLAVVALAFSTAQTVTFIICCCGSFCSRPGEVCRDCDHKRAPQPGRSEG